MQKVFYFFILIMFVLFFMSCSSTKKLSEMASSSVKSTTKSEDAKTFIESRIDTSKMSGLEVTYTRIEYFDPAQTSTEGEAIPEESSGKNKANTDSFPPRYKPPEQAKRNKAVKSIETLSINKVFSKEGKIENRAVSASEKTQCESIMDSKLQTKQETPVPDSRHWRYIFYLALLAVFVFLYFKRTNIFKSLKRLFSK